MKYFSIILIALTLMTGCSQQETATASAPAAPTAIAVETAEVERGSISRFTELSGNVVAKSSLEIMAENTGKVTDLTVEYGDYVEKDQVIAMIDPSKPGMKYEKTELKAPMSGTLTALNIAEGGYASPSMSAGTVTDMTSLKVAVNIPEQYVTAVHEGDSVTLRFDAYPGETLTGTVSFLAPVLDRSSKTRKAEITVDTDKELIIGMYARVSLLTARAENAILVPTSAIVNDSGRSYVYTVEAGVARRHEVATGLYDSTSTEITEGIEDGAAVVVKGQQMLSDGAAVSL